jgi:hypothetical protein
MPSALRWGLAVLVTVIAFTMATWICGTFVLTMRDSPTRWGIAGGLGVAVAALAGLWGQTYATAEHGDHHRTQSPTPCTPVADSTTNNTISGGTFHGPVTQGRDIEVIGLIDSGTDRPCQISPLEAAESPPNGKCSNG